MPKLNEYLDINKLQYHLREGIVECRQHNTLPLHIYCYGRRATYESIWDDVTCKTRGLIVDADTLDIVARPFEKFFNINHAGRPETSFLELCKERESPFIQDKLDGSMGTYWEYAGRYGIATKGSFHSEQAEWATKWMHNHYENEKTGKHSRYWMHPYTPVFEIINQSIQHHVCHYEPQEDNTLRLIGMVNRVSGEELLGSVLEHQARLNGIEHAERYAVSWRNDLLLKVLKTTERPNREGYVISFGRTGKPPLRVKVKHEEFLRLQKIAHYTTPRVVFEYCRLGNWKEIDTVMRDASPYLSNQVKEWVTNYREAFDRISSDARYIVSLAMLECTTRKEFAEFFLRGVHKHLSSVCFKVLDERTKDVCADIIDEKDYKKTVWDLVEPLVKQQKFSEVEEEA